MSRILKEKKFKQFIVLAVSLFVLSSYQYSDSQIDYEAYKYSEIFRYEKIGGYTDLRTGEKAITSFEMEWGYYVSLKNVDTGTYLDNNSKLKVGDTIKVSLKDFEDTDFVWYATGGPVDTPYARLVSDLSSSNPQYCSNNSGSTFLSRFRVLLDNGQFGNVWFTNYAAVDVEKPDYKIEVVPISGGAELDCVDGNNGLEKTCEIKTPGRVAFDVDIDATRANVYYSHYSNENGCIGRYVGGFPLSRYTFDIDLDVTELDNPNKDLTEPVIIGPDYAFYGDELEFSFKHRNEGSKIRFGANIGLLKKASETDSDIYMYIPNDYIVPNPGVEWIEETYLTEYKKEDFGGSDDLTQIKVLSEVLNDNNTKETSPFNQKTINLYEKPSPFITIDSDYDRNDANDVTEIEVGDTYTFKYGYDNLFPKGSGEECWLSRNGSHIATLDKKEVTLEETASTVQDTEFSVKCNRSIPKNEYYPEGYPYNYIATSEDFATLKILEPEQEPVECNENPIPLDGSLDNEEFCVSPSTIKSGYEPEVLTDSDDTLIWSCVRESKEKTCTKKCSGNQIIENGYCVDKPVSNIFSISNWYFPVKLVEIDGSCRASWVLQTPSEDNTTCNIKTLDNKISLSVAKTVGYHTHDSGIVPGEQYNLSCTYDDGVREPVTLETDYIRCLANPTFEEF